MKKSIERSFETIEELIAFLQTMPAETSVSNVCGEDLNVEVY